MDAKPLAEREIEAGAGRGRSTLGAAHEVPLAVQWHEGMLLAPQHFQQLVLRQEALLHFHAAHTSPFAWGVTHLRLDPVRLVDGHFVVRELEAILPDGLVVSSLAGSGSELALDLAPFIDRMKVRPLTIWLAVAAERSGLSPLAGESARYASIEGPRVPDQNTGEGDLRLPRLQPRLRLLATDEPPSKFSCFPLARVLHRNETCELAADFVPPVLTVAPGSPLCELAQSAARLVREKALFLAEQVRSPSLAARVPQLLETRGYVSGLVSALPPFEALLASGVAHPFPLYLALTGLVGEAAALSRSLVPPQLQPYDHHELYATYEQARAFIAQSIRDGILESYTGYPFLLQNGAFYLPFDPLWQGRQLVLGVRAASGKGEAEVMEWMEGGLIASHPLLPELRSRRVLGAPRQRIDGDGDLVPARGVSLYALAPESFVLPGELLEIRNLEDADGKKRPAEIVLYVRNSP